MAADKCLHEDTHTFGPFAIGDKQITVERCLKCDAYSISRRAEDGNPIWLVPIPRSKPEAHELVLNGIANVLEGFARRLRP